MSFKDLLGILSIILAFASYGPYIRSIFVANTKPHAFSWLVWGISSAITFAAQLTGGAGAGGWVTGFSAAVCLGVGVLAIFRGEKDITRGDWISFLATIAAIPLWVLTDNPLWSVVLVTTIDTVAYYPTFRKSYSKPHEELALKYSLTALKHALSVLALQNFTVVTSLYPLAGVVAEAGVVAMLVWRRKALARRAEAEAAAL